MSWTGRKQTMRSLFATLIAVTTLLSWTVTPAIAQDKTFNAPLYRDTRLDWCLTWGSNCGRAAADNFCNRHRFERALVFRAEVVGTSQPTRLIGTNQVCNRQAFCTAFAYITCTEPIPRSRIFANPIWKGHRLDVCLQWGANCGKPAADAFCRSKGFSTAQHAESDPEPGYASTRVISSDQVCTGPNCTGFQQIVCR